MLFAISKKRSLSPAVRGSLHYLQLVHDLILNLIFNVIFAEPPPSRCRSSLPPLACRASRCKSRCKILQAPRAPHLAAGIEKAAPTRWSSCESALFCALHILIHQSDRPGLSWSTSSVVAETVREAVVASETCPPPSGFFQRTSPSALAAKTGAKKILRFCEGAPGCYTFFIFHLLVLRR